MTRRCRSQKRRSSSTSCISSNNLPPNNLSLKLDLLYIFNNVLQSNCILKMVIRCSCFNKLFVNVESNFLQCQFQHQRSLYFLPILGLSIFNLTIHQSSIVRSWFTMHQSKFLHNVQECYVNDSNYFCPFLFVNVWSSCKSVNQIPNQFQEYQ